MSLKNELDIFYALFKEHLSGSQKATLRWVTCKTVNWDEGTMVAEDDEGLPYYDVMLGNGSVLIKPTIESDCLIAIVQGRDEIAFLITASEADQIVFNGGEKGGVINISTLQENINSIKEYVEAVHSAIPIALTAIGAGSAANGSMGAQSYNSSMAGKSITIEDMEDNKIVH